MSAPFLRNASGFRAASLALAVALAGTALPPAPAHAQSFFDALLNALRGRSAPQHILPDPTDPRAWEFGDDVPRESGPPVAYCVRLCDGRYFPLPRMAGGPPVSAVKTCSAMCPASETKVFSGSAIDHALSDNGKRYSSLKNAFVYRERMVDGCSCTGKGTGGVARIDPQSDPTLRPGDIVVTENGPMAFTGNKRGARKGDEFVPAQDYKGLPRSVREAMAELRVARDAPTEPSAAPAPLPAPDPAAPSVTFSPQADLPPSRGGLRVSEAFGAFMP